MKEKERRKSIYITEKAHKKLYEIIGEMMVKEKRNITVNEAVKKLFEIYKNTNKK